MQARTELTLAADHFQHYARRRNHHSSPGNIGLVLAVLLAAGPAFALSLTVKVNGQTTKNVPQGELFTATTGISDPNTLCDWKYAGEDVALDMPANLPLTVLATTIGQFPFGVVCTPPTGTSTSKNDTVITVGPPKPPSVTTTTIPGMAPLPTAPPTNDLEPIRVDPCDVSLQVKGGADYHWFRGYTATQLHRDAEERYLTHIIIPELWRYLRSMPNQCGMKSFFMSQMSTVTQRLTAAHQYDSLFPDKKKTWNVTIGGRHYEIEYYVLRKAQDCSLGSGKAACGKNPNLSDRLQRALDIHIDKTTGVCMAGGLCVPVPPQEEWSSARAAVALADGRGTQPVPSAGPDLDSLHAAHEAHRQSSYGLCGDTGQPACVSVQDAHKAYEKFASTPADAHFRRMMDFSGYMDSVANGNPNGWTDAQAKQLKVLQDQAHEGWMNAQTQGDWALARCFDDRHVKFHDCANARRDEQNFRFPTCDGTYPDLAPIESCLHYLQRQPEPGMPG